MISCNLYSIYIWHSLLVRMPSTILYSPLSMVISKATRKHGAQQVKQNLTSTIQILHIFYTVKRCAFKQIMLSLVNIGSLNLMVMIILYIQHIYIFKLNLVTNRLRSTCYVPSQLGTRICPRSPLFRRLWSCILHSSGTS